MHLLKAAGMAALVSLVCCTSVMANSKKTAGAKADDSLATIQIAPAQRSSSGKPQKLKWFLTQKASASLRKSKPLGTAPWICTPSGFGAKPRCYAR